MDTYELIWRNVAVGSITQTNSDMRSSGDILYKFDFLGESNEQPLLAAFIKHSIIASSYLEEGDDENYGKMCDEEEQYLELINSGEWQLVDDESQIQKILCPIFHENNEITWQTDLSK